MTEGMTEGEIAQLVNRYIGVVDGYLGVPECFSYRTHAEFYSEYCDLSVTMQEGGTTRLKFIATIAALPPRDQAKVLRGVKDRFPPGEEGGPLSRPAMAPKLAEWIERLESTPLVGRANLRISKEVVSKALADADALVASGRPLGAVDRVHTALHGYLQAACAEDKIDFDRADSVVKLLRRLQAEHQGLKETGPRPQAITKVVNAFAQVLDALLPVRNNTSLAHPNDTLLPEAEAYLFINAVRTIFQYLDAKLATGK
jgi:hypothetical protein